MLRAGGPVNVSITIFVSSVSSISEVNMDFTLDFYFRQYWRDPRLNFTDEEDELCISNEMLGKIWWPDTFFATSKLSRFHTATTHNAFLRIKPDGFITQSLRLTVTSTCPMDLTYFPMDTQICNLEIESYAYSVNHIIYNWKDGLQASVRMEKSLQLPQFSIIGYRALTKVEVLSTGDYSRLACRFYFSRNIGYYIIHIYIPSCLIVVLSWISFWLHRDASPARVALGITTVLTMTTLISSTNASLPKISYLKSIDIYLVTCFTMVFASLLEYASVSYLGNCKALSLTRVIHPPSISYKTSISAGPNSTGSVITEGFTGSGTLGRPQDSNKSYSNGVHPVKGNIFVQTNCMDRHTSEISKNYNETPRVNGNLRHMTSQISPHTSGLYNSAHSSLTRRHMTTVDQSLYSARLVQSPHSFQSSGVSMDGGFPADSAGVRYDVRVPSGQPGVPGRQSASTRDQWQSGRGVKLACAIDKYSRVIFPAAFVAFNIIYWVVFLSISQLVATEDDFVPFQSE